MTSSLIHSRRFRPEIQGLRAIAVISVLLFHIWPAAVPGGFVGVDVFFVISGYLITKHLVDEQVGKGRIHFIDFYKRRIRRLLPAATLVLVAIAFGSLAFLPETRWAETGWHIFASAFYGENWHLAWQATDYLAAENIPAPTQHYWSLSIEEQFYIVWPILIVFAAKLAGWLQQSARAIIFVALLFIFCVSLWFSVTLTASNLSQAYFVSHTRFWEMALGGLIAISQLRVPIALRSASGWLGLVMILVPCLLYTKATPFPSYTALLPTVGTVLMILSEDSGGRRWGVYSFLTPKPAQYVGNISYSLYLWHWPLIIFFTSKTGLEADLMNGIGLIAVAVVLSHLTKIYVEDPYRKPSPTASGNPPFLTPVGFLGWTLLISVLSAGLVYFTAAGGKSEVGTEPVVFADYPGAEAVYSGLVPKTDLTAVPALAQVGRDLPKSYRGGINRCHVGFNAVQPVLCVYGDEASKNILYLVGDSHALNWASAFDEFGKKNGYAIHAYTKSGCPVLAEAVSTRGKAYQPCADWGKAVVDLLLDGKQRNIFVSQSAGAILYKGGLNMENVLEDTWRPVIEQGSSIIAIADTGRFKDNMTDCYARTLDNVACEIPLEAVLREDHLKSWAEKNSLSILDFNDGVCPKGLCVPVIGNTVVWRDKHHLTASYSRSLALELERRLKTLLGKG